MAIDYGLRKEALEEALMAGELTVESDGDRVTYRSTAEIRSAIAYCDERLAVRGATSARCGIASWADCWRTPRDR